MGKLTALKVERLRDPGRYQDGQGLMLNVTPAGSKSWVLRVQSRGRRRDIGIGSARDVSLQAARGQAVAIRQQLRTGIDPVLAKRNRGPVASFEEAALALIAEQRGTWSNAKHAAQWLSTLQTYAFPTLGQLPVAEITPPQVRDAILPIWLSKQETARRLLRELVRCWTGQQRKASVPGWGEADLGHDADEAAPRCQHPYTVHGFGSTFRDWAADCTDFPGEVAEAALAHVNPNKVGASYMRSTFAAKRRDLLSSSFSTAQF